jgi:hypothetical protein
MNSQHICSICKSENILINTCDAQLICKTCGISKTIMLDSNCVSHNDKININYLDFNTSRTYYGNVNSKRKRYNDFPSFKKSKEDESEDESSKDKSKEDGSEDESSKDKSKNKSDDLSENKYSSRTNERQQLNKASYLGDKMARSEGYFYATTCMRFNRISEIVEERRNLLKLSDIEISRVYNYYHRMKIEHYPRTIELHALVLIALATRSSTQISYKQICEHSTNITSKELITFVKRTCDNLKIQRPISDPSVMIRKHIGHLRLTRKQGVRAENIVSYLTYKKPTLHPLTQISVSLLIAIDTIDTHHKKKISYDREQFIEYISNEVNTTISTIKKTYDELKFTLPIIFESKKSLKISKPHIEVSNFFHFTPYSYNTDNSLFG